MTSNSFRGVYRSPSEYAHFTEPASDGTPAEVLSRRTIAIADAGRSRSKNSCGVVIPRPRTAFRVLNVFRRRRVQIREQNAPGDGQGIGGLGSSSGE